MRQHITFSRIAEIPYIKIPLVEQANEILHLTMTLKQNLPKGSRLSFVYLQQMGQLIFESDDIERGWDGSSKEKPSPGGIYVWKQQYHWEAVFNNYSDGEKNGNLTLIR